MFVSHPCSARDVGECVEHEPSEAEGEGGEGGEGGQWVDVRVSCASKPKTYKLTIYGTSQFTFQVYILLVYTKWLANKTLL